MKGIKQIKNYRLVKVIGEGSVSTVYEAIDDSTQKKYAVKAIKSSYLQGGKRMESLKKELKILHGLNHPNLIKMIGVEKTVNNVYLILEYCSGGNLLEYLNNYKKIYGKPLPEEDVQIIIRQLINGLEFMHTNKIVHRDITLENILLNYNEVASTYEMVDSNNLDSVVLKIANLGYAKRLDSDRGITICGIPITLAPEDVQLFENSEKDQRYNTTVDLWSLGTITYQLLLGAPPLYAKDYPELISKLSKGVSELPKELKISTETIAFINGLLQFYPERRYTWDSIKKHPFVTNNVRDFHFIELQCIENIYTNPEELKQDTKDCENFVWLMYKSGSKRPLDKLDESSLVKEESGEYEDATELNIGEPEEHDHITKRRVEDQVDDYIPECYNRDRISSEKEYIQLVKRDGLTVYRHEEELDKIKQTEECIIDIPIEDEKITNLVEIARDIRNHLKEEVKDNNPIEHKKRTDEFEEGVKKYRVESEHNSKISDNNIFSDIVLIKGKTNWQDEAKHSNGKEEYKNDELVVDDWEIISTTSIIDDSLIHSEVFESLNIITDHFK
jgi:serine/threonine protein kinase